MTVSFLVRVMKILGAYVQSFSWAVKYTSGLRVECIYVMSKACPFFPPQYSGQGKATAELNKPEAARKEELF